MEQFDDSSGGTPRRWRRLCGRAGSRPERGPSHPPAERTRNGMGVEMPPPPPPRPSSHREGSAHRAARRPSPPPPLVPSSGRRIESAVCCRLRLLQPNPTTMPIRLVEGTGTAATAKPLYPASWKATTAPLRTRTSLLVGRGAAAPCWIFVMIFFSSSFMVEAAPRGMCSSSKWTCFVLYDRLLTNYL